MKYLKRINESKTDYDFIYDCFAELIDNGVVEISDFCPLKNYQKYVTINVKVKSKPDDRVLRRNTKIENSELLNFINSTKYNSNLLQEVEVALNRLSVSYPEYKVSTEIFISSINIQIFATEEEKEDYPF